MLFDLTQWLASVEGRYLDMDEFPREQPYQCHDLWLSQLYAMGGKPGEGYAPSGHTDSVFNSFPHAPNLANLYTKCYGIEGIRAGDVAFWGANVWYPDSHVAVALGGPIGEFLPCMTQNPGPVHRESLITRGLIGYLRPRISLSSTPAHSGKVAAGASVGTTRKDTDMPIVIRSKGSGHIFSAGTRYIKHLKSKKTVERAAAIFNPTQTTLYDYTVEDFNAILDHLSIPLSVANEAPKRSGKSWHDGTWEK